MARDMRPIGEKLKEIDSHVKDVNTERGMGESASGIAREKSERKPFVTNRDTGDEEARKSER